MSWVLAGSLFMAGAFWIAIPDRRLQLLRIGSKPSNSADRLGWLWRGRQGAPALRTRILLGALVAVAFTAAIPANFGGIVGAVAALSVVVGGGWMKLQRQEAVAIRTEFADTVELLAVCLAAGTPMSRALEVVADVSESATASILVRVSGQLRVGMSEHQAWLELADHDVWGAAARDVARSAHSGTSLVEVLQIHADESRLIVQEEALNRARTAGVRSVVPLVTCFLPAFVVVGVVPIIAGLLAGLISP